MSTNDRKNSMERTGLRVQELARQFRRPSAETAPSASDLSNANAKLPKVLHQFPKSPLLSGSGHVTAGNVSHNNNNSSSSSSSSSNDNGSQNSDTQSQNAARTAAVTVVTGSMSDSSSSCQSESPMVKRRAQSPSLHSADDDEEDLQVGDDSKSTFSYESNDGHSGSSALPDDAGVDDHNTRPSVVASHQINSIISQRADEPRPLKDAAPRNQRIPTEIEHVAEKKLPSKISASTCDTLIGLEHLQEQVRKLALRRGFTLNLMVIGEFSVLILSSKESCQVASLST